MSVSDLVIGGLYRHFTGRVVQLLFVTSTVIPDAPGLEPTDILTLRVMSGMYDVYGETSAKFFEVLSEDVQKRFGQKTEYEFMHKGIESDPRNFSTEFLVKELASREDNPFKNDPEVYGDLCAREFYDIGVFARQGDELCFNMRVGGFERIEDAEQWLQKHPSPTLSIVRRALFKVYNSAGELLTKVDL